MPEDVRYKLVDYHYQAFQAHGKSQKFYLLSLTIFLAYTWLSFSFGAENVLDLQWINVRIKKSLLIAGAPIVIAFLLWGLMGAINRAGESHNLFRRTLRDIGTLRQVVPSLHDVDLHPNLLDYAANLTGQRYAQFLYPSVQVIGLLSIIGLGAISTFQEGFRSISAWVLFSAYFLLAIFVYVPCHKWIVGRVKRFKESNGEQE